MGAPAFRQDLLAEKPSLSNLLSKKCFTTFRLFRNELAEDHSLMFDLFYSYGYPGEAKLDIHM